jgi:ammonia channel protein AmtB
MDVGLFRLDDRAAVLVVHGLAGLTGLRAVGILADGTAGQGWNDVTAGGVTGLFGTDGAQAGVPGQLQAQAVGAAVLASLGFFGAWLCFAPLALLARFLTPVAPEPSAALVSAASRADQDEFLAADGEIGPVVDADDSFVQLPASESPFSG